jgi:hypothetical protein
MCRQLNVMMVRDPIPRHGARRAACKHDTVATGMRTMSLLVTRASR